MAKHTDDKEKTPWMRWILIAAATIAALALIWSLFGLFGNNNAVDNTVDTPAIEQPADTTPDVIESNTVETVVEPGPAPDAE